MIVLSLFLSFSSPTFANVSITKISPPKLNNYEAYEFGSSVSTEGNILLISSENKLNFKEKYIFFYQKSLQGTWVLKQTIKLFGGGERNPTSLISLSIKGNRVLVGIPTGGINGNKDQGYAVLYALVNGQWQQQFKFVADDGTSKQYFGEGVAMDGENVLIRSQFRKLYAFNLDGDKWIQIQKIFPVQNKLLDTTELSGNNLLIGEENPNVYDRDGRAYIYHFDGSQWVKATQLSVKTSYEMVDFGVNSALDGNVALVSGYDYTHSKGVIYSFIFDGEKWNLKQEMKAENSIGSNDDFGDFIDLNGNKAVFSSYIQNVGKTGNQGVAYLYRLNNSEWDFTDRVSALHGDHILFGYSAGVDESVAVGSAYGNYVVVRDF